MCYQNYIQQNSDHPDTLLPRLFKFVIKNLKRNNVRKFSNNHTQNTAFVTCNLFQKV